MHGAPSVSYPVGRSPWPAVLGLLAWSLASAALLAWAASVAQPSRLALALVTCVAAGALAWAGWWRQPAGVLGWDGGGWTWLPRDVPRLDGGSVSAVLDLQVALLLRFDGDAGTRWLWLDGSRLPARWDALRRAVYSPAAGQAPSGATPPARP